MSLRIVQIYIHILLVESLFFVLFLTFFLMTHGSIVIFNLIKFIITIFISYFILDVLYRLLFTFFFLNLNVSKSFDIHKQNRLLDRRYYIQHTVILFSGLLLARFMLASNSVSMFHAPMADYLPSVSIVFYDLLLL